MWERIAVTIDEVEVMAHVPSKPYPTLLVVLGLG